MNILSDIIIIAESVKTGERLIGYVCGCKSFKTALENEKYNHNRPIELLTHSDEKYGIVRVYIDNMELYNCNGINN